MYFASSNDYRKGKEFFQKILEVTSHNKTKLEKTV